MEQIQQHEWVEYVEVEICKKCGVKRGVLFHTQRMIWYKGKFADSEILNEEPACITRYQEKAEQDVVPNFCQSCNNVLMEHNTCISIDLEFICSKCFYDKKTEQEAGKS